MQGKKKNPQNNSCWTNKFQGVDIQWNTDWGCHH